MVFEKNKGSDLSLPLFILFFTTIRTRLVEEFRRFAVPARHQFYPELP